MNRRNSGIKIWVFTVAVGLLTAGCANTDTKTSPEAASAPFGGPDSIAYSQKLWKAMEAGSFVGAGAVISKPYQGTHPHGAVLDTIEGTVTVDGHSGRVIVKRNYGGDGVTVAKVADDPAAYLGAVTVMYKREQGYDADNQNWFWVKYKPDGSLHLNPKGMQLAGRVAKGKPAGCIACHQSAPGGDYTFNNDRQ